MKLILVLASALALVPAHAVAQAPPLTKAEQLQDAARKGDAATVKKLLDEGVDVNTKFRYNATALFYACDHGHLEVVKVLLDHGADMSGKDTFYGFTPLMLAVSPAQTKKPAHTEIAKLLIAKGSPGKDFALSSGVDDGDVELVKAVLASGGLSADNLSDALESARAGKKTDVAAALEQAGAKPYDEFKLDAGQLARFAGSYKNAGGNVLVVTVAGARLSLNNPAAPPGQSATLIAKDAVTFRGLGMQGTTFVFKVEGDKVTGFNITPVQGNPATYTRVEGK